MIFVNGICILRWCNSLAGEEGVGGGALPEFKTIALLSCTVYLAVLIGMKSNEVYTKQLALIFFVYTYSTFLYLKFVHLLHETF